MLLAVELTVPWALGIGLVALLVGVAGSWFMERARRLATNQRREDILQNAEREAETLKKTLELTAKEELLQRRSEMDEDHNRTLDQQRQRDSDLERRESTQEEREADFKKRERMLEVTQKASVSKPCSGATDYTTELSLS